MGLIFIYGQLTLYQSVLVSDDSLRISQHISGAPVSPSIFHPSKKKPLRQLKFTHYLMLVKSLIFSYEGEHIILFCLGLTFLNNRSSDFEDN